MKIIQGLAYSFHVIFHPFDGFWDLKHEKRGNIKAAAILYFFLALSVIIKRQLTAYLYNPNDPGTLNILNEAAGALGPFLLWCISNWCFTSLMDGEGSMKDILIATAYALTPMILFNIITVMLSSVLALEEASLYHFASGLAMLWTYGLVFLGMLVTHQYTVKKSLLTAVLTIVGIAVIVFLALLVFYLAQQVIGFGLDVYKELSFRLNE